MRTETDAFYQSDNDSFQVCGMLMPDGDIGISAQDPFDVITVSLSKRKAAKLARHILELSGETKQKLAAENKRLHEALERALSVVNRAAAMEDSDAKIVSRGVQKLLSELGGE